jgi:exosortase A
MSTEDRAIHAPGAKPGVSTWTSHLAVLGGLLAVLIVLYWRPVEAALRVWWVSPTFSHCYLIIPVSAYLIWQRRAVLARLTPVAFPRALILAPFVVLGSWIGTLMAINEIQQLALIAFVQIIALAVLGPQVYRKILFPSLYLFFLVPMGEYLIGPLQRFTTHFISVGLDLMGILHYTEGNTIELANGRYEVAEACAGLRFLIATIAVGVLFAHFMYRKWPKIALFLAACIVVPIIGNGFRALGIVLLAHYSNNQIAVGTDHLVYGWGFSVAILAVLMFIGARFSDPVDDDENEAMPPPGPAGSLPLTVAASVLAIAVVPAVFLWRAEAAPRVDATAFAVPPAAAGWSVGPVSGEWQPVYAHPDARLAFAMHDATPFSPAVDVIVDYYAANDDRNNLITSTNKLWDEDEWHPVIQDALHAGFGGEDVPLGEVQISSAAGSRLIWWTYAAGGRFTTSGMTVKLSRLRALGNEGAALVTVSTTVDSDVDAARVRLRRALASLGGIKQRLAK